MIQRTLRYAVLSAFFLAGTALAHHSLAGVYQMDGEKELAGAVVDIKFVNPHGSLAIAVANADGTSTKWVMTMGSAVALAQPPKRAILLYCASTTPGEWARQESALGAALIGVNIGASSRGSDAPFERRRCSFGARNRPPGLLEGDRRTPESQHQHRAALGT